MRPKSPRPVFAAPAIKASIGAMALACLISFARADEIPYGPVGTPISVNYTFTATNTGEIDAYFAGSDAGYTEYLGMLDNGVLATPTIDALNNQISAIGQEADLGQVTAGDTVTFVIHVDNTDGDIYSDAALNLPYDLNGSDGHNHVYSTAYTATSPIFPGVPVGTFVSFEDLPFPNSDFDYNDTTFVVTNVSVAAPDESSSLILLGVGLAAIGLVQRRRRA
jgi:MYXO-CTERM domain-containing protein